MSTTPTKTKANKVAMRPIWLHVLAAGTWPGQNGQVTIRPADLQQIADSYDPELHEAPAVIGHPATDDPAYGWVRELDVRPDGLWASADLLPEMAEMVRRKMYRKLSVSLYPPDAPANPTSGGFYLKHVGFLGAQAPAVKGLKPVALQAADESLTIQFSQKEIPMEDEETQDTALTADELVAKKRQIELAEADLKKRQTQLRRKELESLITPHVNAGRVLPPQKALLVALAERCDGQSVNFSEEADAQPEPLLDAFVHFLGKLPAQVNLTEVSGPDKLAPSAPQPLNFAAPSGYEVDNESLVLHQKAVAWQSANPGKSYVEAISAVQGAIV